MANTRFLAMAAASLVAVCILTNVSCQEEGDEIDDSSATEKILFDSVEKIAVIRQIAGSNPGAITVVDFPQSLSAIYEPQADKCYLIGGIPSSFPSLQELMDRADSEERSATEDQVIYSYKPADDRPVLDRKILPKALKIKCADKTVQWLEPISAQDMPSTRRWCVGVSVGRVCVGVGGGRGKK